MITTINMMGNQSLKVIFSLLGTRGGVGLRMLEVESVGSTEVSFTAF
jgi:hypothetical protein